MARKRLRAPRLCGVRWEWAPGLAWCCTRVRGHDGEHVAAIGPAADPGAVVLVRWPATAGDRQAGVRDGAAGES